MPVNAHLPSVMQCVRLLFRKTKCCQEWFCTVDDNATIIIISLKPKSLHGYAIYFVDRSKGQRQKKIHIMSEYYPPLLFQTFNTNENVFLYEGFTKKQIENTSVYGTKLSKLNMNPNLISKYDFQPNSSR